MKYGIANKRSQLLKEWILSVLANNEDYYFSTIYTGIPDGDSYETVLEDLKDGFYDDDIDEMLEMYSMVRSKYKLYGWIVNETLVLDENTALKMAGYAIPEKIYMKR